MNEKTNNAEPGIENNTEIKPADITREEFNKLQISSGIRANIYKRVLQKFKINTLYYKEDVYNFVKGISKAKNIKSTLWVAFDKKPIKMEVRDKNAKNGLLLHQYVEFKEKKAIC